MAASAPSYCADQVRRFDHDRYLTSLFAPAGRREDLFALYAFNLEVAKTAEVVSEPALGQMRLQWWRDAIEGIYAGQPPRHEVAAPLAEAVQRHGLDRGAFERLIEAREFDLDEAPPETLAALEDYAEATSAGLVQLALRVLGAPGCETQEGREAVAAGRHVGIAWALVGLLRAVPFHAGQKRLYLPRDLGEAAGLKVGDLFELRSTPALRGVVEQVAERAAVHLGKARAHGARVPKQALPALLPATLASQSLATLEKAGYDPFDAGVQAQLPGRAWRLWWGNLRRRY
jgi:phytoene synthase